MSAASIAEFLNSTYALIVDVRMLNFFRHIGGTAAWVVLGLVLASILVQNFWCRYLCPYGSFFGLISLLSPMRINRNANTCIDCAKCAKACPSALPVDKLVQIRSAECTGCLECVAACPAKDTLTIGIPLGVRRGRAIPAWSVAAGVAVLFLAIVGYAKMTDQWNTTLPRQIYLELVLNGVRKNIPPRASSNRGQGQISSHSPHISLPALDARSMCDLHSQVTRDVLVQLTPPPAVEPGYPLDTFRRENAALKQAIAAARAIFAILPTWSRRAMLRKSCFVCVVVRFNVCLILLHPSCDERCGREPDLFCGAKRQVSRRALISSIRYSQKPFSHVFG